MHLLPLILFALVLLLLLLPLRLLLLLLLVYFLTTTMVNATTITSTSASTAIIPWQMYFLPMSEASRVNWSALEGWGSPPPSSPLLLIAQLSWVLLDYMASNTIIIQSWQRHCSKFIQIRASGFSGSSSFLRSFWQSVIL